ncbi:MAG: hypothetical protein KDC07_09885, partial [Chitinophagaceae bacterium]|nr:hypothetical protein [Chitinophagaceae bacterium]
MKHLLFAALTFLLCVQVSVAQTNKVEYSEPFDEPEDGWRKVLQLSSGNTFFFNYTGKDGIDVSVYDKSRKLIGQKNIQGDNWEPKEFKLTKIAGLYEIGGAPVLFIQQVLKRTPKLFRLVFNPQTGALVSEEQISTLEKFHAGMAFAMVYGGVEEPAFHVEKSPVSDNYAVINFNSISPESDERIEVMYYGVEGGKHKVLAKAFYDAQGFKYVNYIASYVNDKSVFICAYGFNTKNSGGKDSRILISRLDQSTGSFTYKKIEFSDDFMDTKGMLQYNPGSGMLQLFTLTYLSKKSSMWSGKQTTTYIPLITLIDPSSLFIVKADPFIGEYAATHVKEKFNEKGGYSGMPQHMVVNKDNTTTIIQEEIYKIQQQSGSKLSTLETQLGNIAITELDMKGKETIGYAAKKSQKASGDISPFNLSERTKAIWTYQPASLRGNNTPFFSFDYVNTTNGKYLIFNDYPENFHKK